MKKIHFVDNGQDFLWWVIDQFGMITDCGPFQHSIWVGKQIDPTQIPKGGTPFFVTGHLAGRNLAHKIERVERLKATSIVAA